jgi:hypothetical protein
MVFKYYLKEPLLPKVQSLHFPPTPGALLLSIYYENYQGPHQGRKTNWGCRLHRSHPHEGCSRWMASLVNNNGVLIKSANKHQYPVNPYPIVN